MKLIILAIVSVFSLSAYAGPIFEIEKLNFLYSETDLASTFVANADETVPTAINKVRFFSSLERSNTMNSGTQADSSYLGYDFNNLGMIWFDNNLNLYASNFDGSSGVVKLVDGSIIEQAGSDNPDGVINGIYSYNYPGIQQPSGKYDDLGSPAHTPLFPIDNYVYDNTTDYTDFYIECQTLLTCGYDISGMQYFDSKDDGFLNGDLFFVSRDDNGNIKDNSIYAYNFGTNDLISAFTFSELGITDDIAPTRGFAFFNKESLYLPELKTPVEVTEPSTIGLMTIGTVAVAGARTGAIKALCKKSGFCVLIDMVKKTLVGTAKAK